MYIFKYAVFLFILVFLSGCTATWGFYEGGYPARAYQKYADNPEVKRAYRKEQLKIKAQEKSVAKCIARNKARVDKGLPPLYFCGSSYYWNRYYYNNYYGNYYYRH